MKKVFCMMQGKQSRAMKMALYCWVAGRFIRAAVQYDGHLVDKEEPDF